MSLSWKRVLGELALIVGGVLIALTLDSWWEERQDRQREMAYMEQLLQDLRETRDRLQGSIAGDSGTLDIVNSTVDRAYSGQLPPPDSLFTPTGYNQFRPLQGTLVTLVRTGDLTLIRSDSIRFQLIAYKALLDATEAMLRHTETVIWNMTQRVIRARARHSRSARRGDETVGWGQIDVAAALNDPELVSALQVQSAASRNRIRNLRRLEEPMARLIRLLEAETERP